MGKIKIAAVDFETKAIEPRPDYPPKGLSVAIRLPGERKSTFYGWGHVGSPSSDFGRAKGVLADLWRDPSIELVFHNAKFDLEVARCTFGLAWPRWEKIHDTLVLAFLVDPYSKSLSLKPLAQRYLHEPPDEKDELIDWLKANVPEVKRAPSKWFAYLHLAPHDLVGRYAKGDTDRTIALYNLFMKDVKDRKMTRAYERERRLLRHLLRMEAEGIPVAADRLTKDAKEYAQVLDKADVAIRRRLKVKDLDVDKREHLANAIEQRGLLTPEGWVYTEKGTRATGIDSLKQCVTDPTLIELLDYRAILATSLRTFIRPWAETAAKTARGGLGRIYTTWNQVKSDYHASGGGSGFGTKTGRLSSSPNMQNIVTAKTTQPKGFPPLPLVRSYIVPPTRKGAVLGRDYSQQEFRMLAHYEDGALAEAYRFDPHMDVHKTAQVEINTMLNANFERRPIKNTGFGLIYGMGIGKLAMQSGTSIEIAKRLKRAYLIKFPGIKDINATMKQRARDEEPIRTWGGRLYYCEPPFNGRTFDYRLINTLIQGSSADYTKEAMVRYMDLEPEEPLYLTVHDELVSGTRDWKYAEHQLEVLREVMEGVELDVPMISDGAWSRGSWADLK